MPEQNRLLISPEDDFAYGAGIPRDATWRNLIPAAELGLAIAPGSGEAMAARDAWNASGRGANALLQGQYGDAASNYANALLALGGAIPGAGIIARGTKRGAAWMDRNLPQGFNRLLDAATPKASQDTMYAIPAWHGSPHDFDEFKLDKIGTGEGAQAYGHGLYFAENPATAKVYKENLSNREYTLNGEPLDAIGNHWADVKRRDGDLSEHLKNWQDDAEYYRQMAAQEQAQGKNPAANLDRYETARANAEAIDRVQKGDVVSATPGRLYKTELDVEPEDLLDWDLPLSQQSEKVQKALGFSSRSEDEINAEAIKIMEAGNAKHGRAGGWMDDPEAVNRINKLQGELDSVAPNISGADYYRGANSDIESTMTQLRGTAGQQEMSQRLREAGIPGIRYLDQGSRGSGEGTRNYVIFSDDLVKILSKE